MNSATDVFIVGGGPAGLAAAIAAQSRGFRVTVADGARPPIDKPCGEGLLPDTLAALSDLGVTIQPEEGHALRGIRFIDKSSLVQADFPRGLGAGVRRTVLHEKMVQRARSCGVDFLWNTSVTSICDEGVVVGGRVMPARWIIGADGGASRVRGWMGLEPHHASYRFAFRRHYRVKPWSGHAEVYWGTGLQAYVTPLTENDVCVAIISRDPHLRLENAFQEFPQLAKNLLGVPAISTERGAITAMRRLDHLYRGNVVLIGDASGGVDAITGEGLGLAFRQASALAAALATGDLARYEREHRQMSRRPTLMARLMLLLDQQHTRRQRVLRVLAADPGLFARLVSVHVGVTSPAHLATPGALFGLGIMLTA
ncbi:MAG: NAD(P)/FAD-dependent oxidoreductase [Candidatus Acidiferrum sp.]